MCGLLAQLTAWAHLQGDMVKIEDQCKRLSDLVSFLCNTSAKKDNGVKLISMDHFELKTLNPLNLTRNL